MKPIVLTTKFAKRFATGDNQDICATESVECFRYRIHMYKLTCQDMPGRGLKTVRIHQPPTYYRILEDVDRVVGSTQANRQWAVGNKLYFPTSLNT
jgi:hypothetical protein